MKCIVSVHYKYLSCGAVAIRYHLVFPEHEQHRSKSVGKHFFVRLEKKNKTKRPEFFLENLCYFVPFFYELPMHMYALNEETNRRNEKREGNISSA